MVKKLKSEPLTELEKEHWPAHGVVKLEKPFVDSRGSIQPLVDTLMKSAVVIVSKAGSLRANHYHKTDWHYCYVVSGKIEYLHRPAGSTAPPELVVVNTGEMIFTPPMIEHGMQFPVDTVFLTLGRNPRDQATYEADVVRVDFISTAGLTTWTPGDEQSRGDKNKDSKN